jgi:hypothetical protein
LFTLQIVALLSYDIFFHLMFYSTSLDIYCLVIKKKEVVVALTMEDRSGKGKVEPLIMIFIFKTRSTGH